MAEHTAPGGSHGFCGCGGGGWPADSYLIHEGRYHGTNTLQLPTTLNTHSLSGCSECSASCNPNYIDALEQQKQTLARPLFPSSAFSDRSPAVVESLASQASMQWLAMVHPWLLLVGPSPSRSRVNRLYLEMELGRSKQTLPPAATNPKDQNTGGQWSIITINKILQKAKQTRTRHHHAHSFPSPISRPAGLQPHPHPAKRKVLAGEP